MVMSEMSEMAETSEMAGFIALCNGDSEIAFETMDFLSKSIQIPYMSFPKLMDFLFKIHGFPLKSMHFLSKSKDFQ